MSTTEDNTELVRSYLRAFNHRDWEALTDYLAPDVVEHGVHDTLDGPDEIVAFLRSYFEVFPDYEGRTETTVAEGDTVAVRYSATGTHSDRYRDVDPTAHTVTWAGMAMYRVEGGQIAEVWVEEDRIGLLEQLEAVDPPAHLRI